MNLDDSDLMRLEKAAYGLAGAPRAWFMRLLCRELAAADQISVCVSLVEVCGVHVDDLISGGTRESEMDQVLQTSESNCHLGISEHIPSGTLG